MGLLDKKEAHFVLQTEFGCNEQLTGIGIGRHGLRDDDSWYIYPHSTTLCLLHGQNSSENGQAVVMLTHYPDGVGWLWTAISFLYMDDPTYGEHQVFTSSHGWGILQRG